MNAVHLHQTLKCALEGSRFELFGIDISPIKFIGYENENAATAEETLDAFVNEVDIQIFFMIKMEATYSCMIAMYL